MKDWDKEFARIQNKIEYEEDGIAYERRAIEPHLLSIRALEKTLIDLRRALEEARGHLCERNGE